MTTMASTMPNFRCCLVCGRELVTCKTYVSLKGRQELLDILMECVGEKIQMRTTQTICRTCHTKILKVKTLKDLKEDVAQSCKNTNKKTSKMTGQKENISPEDEMETPKKIAEPGRVKRMALSSPGSPSVSQVNK